MQILILGVISMVQKKWMILHIYEDENAVFLKKSTILKALEKRGYSFSEKSLSHFIRNNLEQGHLVPHRNTRGVVTGWKCR